MSDTETNEPEEEIWTPCARRLPPNGKVVLTRIHDERGPRNQQKLIREGLLWFFDDHSMYVYYTPTHWRELPESPAGKGLQPAPGQ